MRILRSLMTRHQERKRRSQAIQQIEASANGIGSGRLSQQSGSRVLDRVKKLKATFSKCLCRRRRQMRAEEHVERTPLQPWLLPLYLRRAFRVPWLALLPVAILESGPACWCSMTRPKTARPRGRLKSERS